MSALFVLAWACLVSSAWARTQPHANYEDLSHVPRRMLQSDSPGSGFWSVQGSDFLDGNGQPVRFSGVTWSGFQTPNRVVGGLAARSIESHLDQMKSLGLNMIRIPFSGDIVNPYTYPAYGACGNNSDLWPLTSLQVLDRVVAGAGQRGMKVILDYHRVRQTWESDWGVWWDNVTAESVWVNNWAALAQRYKGNTTIIGVDLFNEVHPNLPNDNFPGEFPEGAPYWTTNAGDNEEYNFRSASLRAIKVIHDIEPNWIIFLEGMWNEPYWWGGNCAKLLEAPITEPAGKLAYSAHDYGPFVAPLPWFFDPSFPSNLIPIYRQNWGLIVEKGIAPLWIGEFGSKFPANTSDLNWRERTVFTTQISYIQQLGASWTIAFWGPDSTDVGGILKDDWKTPNQEKLAVLQPIMYPSFSRQT